jgi:hypothetical protein
MRICEICGKLPVTTERWETLKDGSSKVSNVCKECEEKPLQD